MRTQQAIQQERYGVLAELGRLAQSWHDEQATRLARLTTLDAEMDEAAKAATPEAIHAAAIAPLEAKLNDLAAYVESIKPNFEAEPTQGARPGKVKP